jgi:hypothetical protein
MKLQPRKSTLPRPVLIEPSAGDGSPVLWAVAKESRVHQTSLDLSKPGDVKSYYFCSLKSQPKHLTFDFLTLRVWLGVCESREVEGFWPLDMKNFKDDRKSVSWR